MLSAKQEDTLTKNYQAVFDTLLNAAMDQTLDTQFMPARYEQLGLVSQVVALKCVVLPQVPDIIKLIQMSGIPVTLVTGRIGQDLNKKI